MIDDWANDADGSWTVNSSWVPSSGFPNANVDEVNLTNDITADRTVTLNSDVTVRRLELRDLSGTSNWSITGSGTLTFNSSGTLAFFKALKGNNNQINVPIMLGTNLILEADTSAEKIVIKQPIGETGGSRSITLPNSALGTHEGTLILTTANSFSVAPAGTLRRAD